MASSNWFDAAISVAFAALLLIIARIFWDFYYKKLQISKKIQQRLTLTAHHSPEQSEYRLLNPFEIFQLRTDLNLTPLKLIALFISTLLVSAVILYKSGLFAWLIVQFFIGTAVYLIVLSKFGAKRKRIHEELPQIIDVVLRYVNAGRSLDKAIIDAFREASPIFKPLRFRLQSAIEAGRDYTYLLEDFSELYKVPSVILVAMSFRTSSRFGSNIQPMLKQVSESLRANQSLRREFMAATAEVRFTAFTFSILPPLMAVYMVLMNDEYAAILLKSETGHTLIAIAGVLQILGMSLIWKMISEVGRA